MSLIDFKDLSSQISPELKKFYWEHLSPNHKQFNIKEGINNLLNKSMLKSLSLFPGFTFSLILYFPNAKLRKFLKHLDNFPILSYKFTNFLKLRKIYRICQRKEVFHQRGVLKILSLWNTIN